MSPIGNIKLNISSLKVVVLLIPVNSKDQVEAQIEQGTGIPYKFDIALAPDLKSPPTFYARKVISMLDLENTYKALPGAIEYPDLKTAMTKNNLVEVPMINPASSRA